MPRGGARPGAGRPRKGDGKPKNAVLAPETPVTPSGTSIPLGNQTPLEYLLAVMNDPSIDDARRDRAAGIAAAYVHPKAGDMGKKGEREKAADVAAKGRYAPAAPPKLVINNR